MLDASAGRPQAARLLGLSIGVAAATRRSGRYAAAQQRLASGISPLAYADEVDPGGNDARVEQVLLGQAFTVLRDAREAMLAGIPRAMAVLMEIMAGYEGVPPALRADVAKWLLTNTVFSKDEAVTTFLMEGVG